MAPEQALGSGYTKKIDMWAIGVIMHQLLTGKHPFLVKGEVEKTYIERITKDNLGIKEFNLEDAAKSLFLKLCSKSPMKRYVPTQALQHPWITGNNASTVPLT